MTAYFRKSIKIAPGVHINLSKRGTGVSFGGRGAHVSFSPTGRITKTVSIPGTGIYYRDTSTNHSRSKKSPKTTTPNVEATNLPVVEQPAAHQVVAVEHHGFYISHGFAAFALVLIGVIVANSNQTHAGKTWAVVLIIAGLISLVLWIRDLFSQKAESERSHG